MELTNKQIQGLKISIERYKNREPYTCISGYAGSGKTTLINFIIAALKLHPDNVAYVAYTGKAATVLKQKGCSNAVTAHKLLYYAKQLPSGKFTYKPRKRLEDNYKLIVVDEVSMLPKTLWELLLSHKIPVIACGDPGQLPPIDKNEDNHVLDNPHVFLDEIMRQAQDSEIIRLSMHIREGKPISTFQSLGEQVKIIKPKDVVSGMYDWADQVLCATNEKRNMINRFVRENKEFGYKPCIGDKVISLHNHWEFYSGMGNWTLTNGCIGTISDFRTETISVPKSVKETRYLDYMITDVEIDGDKFFDIPIDYYQLISGESSLTPKQQYIMRNNPTIEIEPPYDFAYAYAITVWKAQGSEWKKVMAYEEGHPFDKKEHIQYLYTAVTRASEKLVLVTKSN